jgi:hypothetical protein
MEISKFISKKTIKIILRLLSIVLIVSNATGCQNGKLTSFIDQNSCELPCWNGTILGNSTKTEFISSIIDLPFVEKDSIIGTNEGWSFFDDQVIFTFSNANILGRAHIIKTKVMDLSFEGELNTTIGQLIDILGDPEYIINIPSPSTSSIVTAIYPSLGAKFSYDTRDIPRKFRQVIHPDIPVKYIYFFDPEIYNQLLDKGLIGLSILSREETIKYMKGWAGYGELKILYPPAQ